MPDFLPYNVVLSLHIGAFVWNIVLVVLADANAARWVFGWVETLSATIMRWLHRLIGAGLAVAIISGALLFLEADTYLLTIPAFYVKLAFVAALVINAYVIGKHISLATTRSFASLTNGERWPLYISGVVSTVSWIGTFTAAQFLGL